MATRMVGGNVARRRKRAIKQCSRKSASPAASGRRSAAFCGAFVDVSAVELGKTAVERSGVKSEDVQTMIP